MTRPALMLHGGAGARHSKNYDAERAQMAEVVTRMAERLNAGAAALDVAVEATVLLEDSGLYVAGRGGSPNLVGDFELDASLMDGSTGRVGSVAALQGFRNPVVAARAVMDHTPHVLLAGAGAAAFAADQGLDRIEDPAAWFTRAGQGEDNHPPGSLAHGTVGCCVLDTQGRLAAATSTAGVFGKMPGRVGDSPVVGCGVWADARVAVSCTGQGEYFMRTLAAARVGWVMETGASVDEAAWNAINAVAMLGGDGGLIALDAQGRVAHPRNSEGMKRAWLTPEGEIRVAVFEPFGDEAADLL